MKAATHFLIAFGLSINLFADSFVSAAFTSLSSVIPSLTASNTTTAYIVELSSAASNSSSKRKRSLTPHQDLYNELRRKDVAFSSGTEWHSEQIFVGVELVLNSLADLDAVANADNVVAVRPVLTFQPPALVRTHSLTGSSDPALPPDTQSTHVMTGVDMVHAGGNFGQDIKIGVIDSGVDYLNPTLGGGFGPGFLVAGGYDFVGNAYTGANTPVPDADPLDTCFGHGTHVTGIIAAQPGNIYNITGVAYKSSIYAYRVFGCTGGVQDPITVNALLKAYDDGMDVITLSIGGASGWSESTTSIIASRIVEKGRVVTASIGNDGAQGAWYPSAPGTGKGVISVGSVENTQLPAINAVLSDGHAPVPYFSLRPFPVTTSLPIYATSKDITVANDACNALPSSTPNLAGYVVVIRRGGCAIVDKLKNAAAKGGKYFFIYNDGTALGVISTGTYIGALIRAEDGAYLVNAFKTNANLRVSFPQTLANTVPVDGGGLVSSFSGMGPTYELNLSPAVMAPGGNVISTMPRNMGTFGVSSGTSMAAPFAAGAAALILKAKGKDKDTCKSVKGLLQSTAGMIPTSSVDGAPIASAAQQGAGLINVYQAIQAQSVITTTELLLNDTLFGSNYQLVIIRNPTKKTVTYNIDHAAGITLSTVNPSNGLPNMAPIPTVPQTAGVTIVGKQVTVWPKLIGMFIVKTTPPTGLDAKTFPIYSGYITICSSLGETFSIPYMGTSSRMRDMPVLDQSDVFFEAQIPIMLTGNGYPADAGTSFTLVGSDYPAILYRRAAGSPSILADLVSPNTTVPGAVQARSLSKRGTLWNWLKGIFGNRNNQPTPGTFANVRTVGPIQNVPYSPRHEMEDAERSGYDFVRVQNYLNTTSIANGQYKLLLRALKVTGNAAKQEDYESWLSPVFTVNAPTPSASVSANTTLV